ncbi:MAG: hypothetical protein WA485_23405 [Candidatus Sulfotelmatobacter sp.]
MGKIRLICGVLLFALVMSTGWQLAACEFANYEFRDDLKDIAAMAGSRIGLLAQSSDDDLRDAIIRRAAGHDIHLGPDQIRVERSGTLENPKVFLVAKYRARVVFPGLSVIFHFSATSG